MRDRGDYARRVAEFVLQFPPEEIEPLAARFGYTDDSACAEAGAAARVRGHYRRDEFLTGVQRYFRKHEYGNTTLTDLLAPLSESSGRDLTAWVDQWLKTSQVNTLRPVFELTEAESQKLPRARMMRIPQAPT